MTYRHIIRLLATAGMLATATTLAARVQPAVGLSESATNPHAAAGRPANLPISLAAYQTCKAEASAAMDVQNWPLAESLLRGCLIKVEALDGPEHLSFIADLNAMARVLEAQGKTTEANLFYRRVLAIQEKVLGPQHPDTAASLAALASNIAAQGRLTEAEPLFRRALAVQEAILGALHPNTARTISALAANFDAQGRYQASEHLHRRAVDILQIAMGRDHVQTAVALDQLGNNLILQGRQIDAEEIYLRTLAIYQKGSCGPNAAAANTGVSLARVQLALSKSDAALATARMAYQTAIAVRGRSGCGTGALRKNAAADAAYLFARAAYTVASKKGGDPALAAEAFKIAQEQSNADEAEARATLWPTVAIDRLDPKGRAIASEWLVAKQQRTALDGVDPIGIDNLAMSLARADQRAKLDIVIGTAEKKLRSDYPGFFEAPLQNAVEFGVLRGPSTDKKPALRPDEALLLIMPGNATMPEGQRRGLVFAATREGLAWAEIAAEPIAFAAQLKTLNQRLDPLGSNSGTGPAVRGSLSSGALVTGGRQAFDRTTANQVYEALFSSPAITQLIADKPEWLISGGGSAAIPFPALVMRPPTGDDADPSALRATHWLGLSKAVTLLPSVSSFVFMRQVSPPSRTNRTPFFGVGDPDYRANDTSARNPLGSLASLPSTRKEIFEIKSILKGTSDSILIGSEASERNLRLASADGRLARAKIVDFAVHGLVPGDLGRTNTELALALVPSAPGATVRDPANDGFVTADEIATLRFNADLVIIASCNLLLDRDGKITPLVSALFYAGADSLMISSQRLRDDVAVRLAVRTVQQLHANPTMTRAAALQQARKDLIADVSNDKFGLSFADPSGWAGFVIVGAGR
jgi:tetratricopeptide (TPR) repeat protein